jgi:cytochrome c5
MKKQILPNKGLSLRSRLVAPLASIGIIIFLLVGATGCTEKKATSGKESSLEAVTERIRPVGKVNVVSAPEETTGAEGTSSASEKEKPQEKSAAESQGASTAGQAASTATSGQGELARGKAVVEKSCAPCHSGNLPGAPVIGNSADWASRLSQGEETLIQHVINGYNAMPPRGGNPGLSNEDIAAAVNYLISQVK